MIDRKKELISVARELIAERGYDSFSYADLSQRTGLAKPSIHHHFASKADLTLAVIDHIEAGLRAKAAACTQVHGDAALLPMLHAIATQNWGSKICPLASLQSEFNVLPAEVQKRLHNTSEAEVGILATMLENYTKLPDKQLNLPPQDAARLLLCAAKGALLYGRTDQKIWLEEVLQNALKLVLRSA